MEQDHVCSDEYMTTLRRTGMLARLCRVALLKLATMVRCTMSLWPLTLTIWQGLKLRSRLGKWSNVR